MPLASLALVAFDCPDPRSLADFYMSIIGGHIKPETASEDWVRVVTGQGVDLGFQRDPNHVPPGWPHDAQQAHLDLDVDDLEAAELAVITAGAVKADQQPAPHAWRVFLDPAGHPFCLIQR